MKRLLLVLLLLWTATTHADYWQIKLVPNLWLPVDSTDMGIARYVYFGFYDARGVLAECRKRQNNDSTAWEIIPTGEVSRHTNQPTYVIRNVATGRYISGVGITSLGRQRAWDWVFYPGESDSLFSAYPETCHFVEEGDTLMGYSPRSNDHGFIQHDWVPILYERIQDVEYVRYLNLLDSLGAAGVSYDKFYVVGSEAGQIGNEQYQALIASVQYLQRLDVGLPDSVYAEATTRFYRAKAAADSAATHFADGYYQLFEGAINWPNAQWVSSGAWMSNGDKRLHKKMWEKSTQQAHPELLPISDPRSVFKVSRRADGGYDLQSIYDSLYVQPTQANGQAAVLAEARPTTGFRALPYRGGHLRMYSFLQEGNDRNLYFFANRRTSLSNDSVYDYFSTKQINIVGSVLLQRVAPETADSLARIATQTRRDIALNQLIKASLERVRQSMVYNIDYAHPVVSDSTQLSCNALDGNPRYHHLSALIDSSNSTVIRTVGGNTDSVYNVQTGRLSALPDARHYLQAAARATLPDSIVACWTLGSAVVGIPIEVKLLKSRDGAYWEDITTLSNKTETLPTDLQAPDYTSHMLRIGKGYRLLRMEVVRNQDGKADRYGHANLALAAFNIYPVTGINRDASQGLRPEVATAVETLKRAIDKAAAIPPRTATPADVAELQQAYDALLAVWADTAKLDSAMTVAVHYAATASVGTGIGQTTQTAIDELQSAIMAAQDLRPFGRLTRVEANEAAQRLLAAINTYLLRLEMPQAQESYFIVSASTGRLRGQCIVAEDYATGSYLNTRGTTVGNEQNARAAWRFVPLADKGCYALQNMSSGLYLSLPPIGSPQLSDTITPYRIVPINRGQMALQAVLGDRLVAASDWLTTLQRGDTLNSAAWTFTAVDHERMTDIKFLHPRAAQVVCLPYATTQLPTSIYAPLEWYEPLGLECDDEGRIVGLALGLTPDETLQPGKPYVLVMGPSIESDDDDLAVDMCMDLDAPATVTAPTPAAGLRGTFAPLHIARPGVAYFDRSNTLRFTTDTAEVLIATHSGFVVPAALPRLAPGAAADLTLLVAAGYRLVQFLDHNGDGRLNLPDAITIITRITAGEQDPLGLTDHNADGRSDLPDATTLIKMMVDE